MAETMNSLEFRAQRRNQESPNEAAIANAQELRKRVEAAIIIKHRIDDSAMRERLENELLATNEPEVIEGFLAAADLIAILQHHGIILAPGEGAIPGSLIAWLLGITEINPLDYGLICEIFANRQQHTFHITVPLDRVKEAADIATNILDTNLQEEPPSCLILILGRASISHLQTVVTCLKKSGTTIDLRGIPLDDQATYSLIDRGDVVGVMSLTGTIGNELCVAAHPKVFDDLISIIVMGFCPQYIVRNRLVNLADTYFNSNKTSKGIEGKYLKAFTRDSRGWLIYDEQLVKAINAFTGWTLSRSEEVRKSLGKKKADIVDQIRKEFIEASGSIAALSAIDAEKVFYFLLSRVGFIMFRSHCVAEALTAYRSAWLKTHFPNEFTTISASGFMDI
jgi:DNA polymerase III alpha subunit